VKRFERYAVYVTPGDALGDLGAAWLGWDIARGHNVPHPVVDGIDAATLTGTSRKYGFHGTIKPPFVLAPGATADDLLAQAESLCSRLPPITLAGLDLAALGRFLALVPMGDATGLADIAGTVVQTLDPLRAAPDAAELAQRRQAHLTPAQEANLLRWGYPYVLDQFRFHMTLTSKLPRAQVEPVRRAMMPLFAPHLARPFVIDSLTVVGQGADGMFRTIRSYPLIG
jgi:hypothetical protein